MNFKGYTTRTLNAENVIVDDCVELGGELYQVVAVKTVTDMMTTTLWFYPRHSTQLMNPVMLTLPWDEDITIHTPNQ